MRKFLESHPLVHGIAVVGAVAGVLSAFIGWRWHLSGEHAEELRGTDAGPPRARRP